jgi:hypothetical protein
MKFKFDILTVGNIEVGEIMPRQGQMTQITTREAEVLNFGRF